MNFIHFIFSFSTSGVLCITSTVFWIIKVNIDVGANNYPVTDDKNSTNEYCTVPYVYFLSFDFLNNIFFYLAYFFVRIPYIIYSTRVCLIRY